MLRSNEHNRPRGIPRLRQLEESCRRFRVPPRVYSRAVRNYLEALSCPRSLTVWLLFKYQEFDQLVDLDPNFGYMSEVDFASSYAATLLFAKYADFPLTRDRKVLAKEKFDSFEFLCKATNKRFSNPTCDPLYRGPAVWLHDAIKRKIAGILGNLNIDEVLRLANWGPGATTLIKGNSACAANKFQCETGITRDLYQILSEMDFFSLKSEEVKTHEDGSDSLLRIKTPFSETWSDALSKSGFPTFFIGNQIEYVPKTSKIDRIIFKEPGLNLWFQKGIGSVIRRRLLRVGLDLNSQEKNQLLALRGSIDDSLCTIDFSSASDSISRNIVEELLPPRWFSFLDSCRSHYGLVNGCPVLWSKFSSMGNAFTFELESLIFYAIAKCCDESVDLSLLESEHTAVFGDDVILNRKSLTTFSLMCEFYGFVVNPKKSYFSHDFRESCGSHYLRGRDCKPFYLKGRVTDLPDLFLLHNSIKRLSLQSVFSDRRESLLKCCRRIVRCVPKTFRFRVPAGLGDGGFLSSFDEAMPPIAKHGFEGFRVTHLVEGSIPFPFSGVGLLLASLWSLGQRDRLTDRGRRLSYLKPVKRLKSHHDFVARRGFSQLKLVTSIIGTWLDPGDRKSVV